MKVNGFAHCALYTTRLEETVQFYMDVFGAESLGAFQASSKGYWLQLGKDILEIFEGKDLGTGCFKHIAIACDDVDGYYNRAIELGGSAMMEPKDMTLPLKTPVSARLAFVKGINGEQIELFCVKEA